MANIFSGPPTAFRTRLFGFDKEEVRDCLMNLVSDYEEAKKDVGRLTSELKTSGGEVRPPASDETLSVRVERVLTSADRVAEEVRKEAEVAAKRILRQAQEEAAQLRSRAETDASALTSTAAARVVELEVEIERMTARRQEVQELLERGADRLNETARAMRQALTTPSADSTEPEITGDPVTVRVKTVA